MSPHNYQLKQLSRELPGCSWTILMRPPTRMSWHLHLSMYVICSNLFMRKYQSHGNFISVSAWNIISRNYISHTYCTLRAWSSVDASVIVRERNSAVFPTTDSSLKSESAKFHVQLHPCTFISLIDVAITLTSFILAAALPRWMFCRVTSCNCIVVCIDNEWTDSRSQYSATIPM